MPGTVLDGPTVSLSFANNFWGKEDAGVHPLLERMHNAKVTCDELKTFYNTRAAIEDEYSRKLAQLCRKPLGSSETGTLRASLDVMRGEVESMAKSHQGIAGQMKCELEEPLAAFSGAMKERRKIVQGGIEKLHKQKTQQTQAVNKSRDKYEQDCLKIKGYLAQGHMVMGQEERKNKAKLEKTQIQVSSASNEYEIMVKALEETTGKWNRDWKAACDKFQDLEEERLDFLKSSLWTFANVASTVCVSDDASCERIRLSLENCEVEKDITNFIQERGTGQEIPDPPRYINFCRGDVNDAASETSEDDGYSVAQFQRTINPAFRSSSPQPSTYESHHDPHSNVSHRMEHQDASPSSRDSTMKIQQFAPQAQPAPPIIDYRPTAKDHGHAQVPLARQGDLPVVPHNDYPTDGMTMFCRTDAPSDRSSVNSPVRPISRDSQSDYSNPTSLSSIEPASGKQSPIKQNTDPMSTPASPEKSIQKKRSGFFSNSPFRRKSKHEKEGRDQQAAMAPPASSRTWGPSSGRNSNSNNLSPTRSGIQSRDFADGQGSHSPEPVDPRANFQLNVGPNVFDVASPDSHRKPGQPSTRKAQPGTEEDPIAAALAELRGVTKQSSVRMSADRYHGLATPAPSSQASVPTLSSQGRSPIAAAQRGTPPPSYHDQAQSASVRRLDLPQPAFTSRQMQQTTQKYTSQNQDMYGPSGRQGTGGIRGSASDIPRAVSPSPMRSTSPRPGMQQQRSGYGESKSPNSHAGRQGQSRHGQQQMAGGSPTKQDYGSNGYSSSSRHGSPGDVRRSASPQPMALQLGAMDGQRQEQYGGSQRGRGGNVGMNNSGRPVSYYGSGGGNPTSDRSVEGGSRQRSKSVSDGRQFTRDGREILHFARAMYVYSAAIPEELSFQKGDILAVLRLQDDGWWEAESTGRKGRPGLVPSNYLQRC